MSEMQVVEYAGFWRRFGAFWIDCLCFLPLFALSYLLESKYRLFQVYYFLPSLLFGLWFHVYLVKRYGGTPGKLILKIQIQKLNGSHIDGESAFLRYSVMFILSVLMSVATMISVLKMTDVEYQSGSFLDQSIALMNGAPGWYKLVNLALQAWVWSEFIVMLMNKKRRALHDFMAGTVVVKVAEK